MSRRRLTLCYTAPCEIVFFYYTDHSDPYAERNIQTYIVESNAAPEHALLFCVLVQKEGQDELFVRRLTAARASAAQRVGPAMLNIQMENGGLFLSFPDDDILDEFRQAVMDSFGPHTAEASDSAPDLSTPEAGPPEPRIHGISVLTLVDFLRQAAAAVAEFLQQESAESTSGTPETLRWHDWRDWEESSTEQEVADEVYGNTEY